MFQVIPRTRHHRHPRKTFPFITASKHGRLVINKPAMLLLQRRGVSHVHLLFDVEQHLIALRQSHGDDNAFRLNYRRAQVDLNVPNFWHRLGVQTQSGSRRFPASWDDNLSMLTANIQQ